MRSPVAKHKAVVKHNVIQMDFKGKDKEKKSRKRSAAAAAPAPASAVAAAPAGADVGDAIRLEDI